MQREHAPLYEQLVDTAQRGHARFHVPGHKSGTALDPLTIEHFRSIMDIDMTEIPGLDDLHQPDGVIQEAQSLAAACFGAEETFFLVGGSTAGNMAMIMAACDRGDLLLMQRNVHKSAIHACMLAGCRVAFLNPRWDSRSGLAAGVSAASVREALHRFPEAKAIFITNPNYYGMGSDLKSIADVAHAGRIPLLVDEAHGAHYGFHPDVPASAMACGADAAVQSTHKMLTSLTMGAMLHVQGNRVDRGILKQRLAMLQSSSPSYPIMASLDLSRRLMHVQGTALIQSALERTAGFHKKLTDLGLPFEVLPPSPAAAYETLDPFKIAVRAASGYKLSGFQLQEQLGLRGCVAEMADPHYVLLALSPLTSNEELDLAIGALQAIGSMAPFIEPKGGEADLLHAVHHSNWMHADITSVVSEPVTIQLPPVRGRHQEVESVKLTEANGRAAAEMIIPYPPGIPILYPGETITEHTIADLIRLAELGARFQGAADSTMNTVLVRNRFKRQSKSRNKASSSRMD